MALVRDDGMGEGLGWADIYQHGKFGMDAVAVGVVCEVKYFVGEWKSVPWALPLKTEVMI